MARRPGVDLGSDGTPGTWIEATLLGTSAPQPEHEPARWLMIGDTASLPALNSLLDALPHPDVPVRLFCEFQRPEEQWLPLRATRGTEPTWVPST